MEPDLPPRADRPYMPGYGIAGPQDGSGLLPWSWAAERLSAAHDYWVGTVRPDGAPHAMPVWGLWDGAALWFSSSLGSRKARNLRAHPTCVVHTADAHQPVVVEGVAEQVVDEEQLQVFVADLNAKYGTDYGLGFFDPTTNAVFRVAPRRVIGLDDADFTGTPTRWTFG